jgi:hypothetical protein
MDRKNQKKSLIPSTVANFVIGLIDKCGHKLISLDPARSRTKQDKTLRFPDDLIIEFTIKQEMSDIPLNITSLYLYCPCSTPVLL